MYHYAGNNPVKYTDPDGNDIEEVPFLSVTGGIGGAGRLSVGVAVDSRGNVAVYGKAEVGVGAGVDIGLDKLFSSCSKGIKILSRVVDSVNYTESGIEILGNIISLPEDTGKGNLSAGFMFKGETIKNWDAAPAIGAFFVGVESDKKGKASPSIGIQVIAAAFLASGTVYGTIYSQEWLDNAAGAFSNEYRYYEQQLWDYNIQELDE